MLKQAFNLIMRLHSQEVVLKRLGSPDIFSPVRIAPSNYFRFLEGPGSTTIHGREFVIPIDSIRGQYTQLIRFFVIVTSAEVPTVPTEGSFHLQYSGDDTVSINFDATATDVRDALRAISGLENVTVAGDFTSGFLVTFIGVNTPELLVPVQDMVPLDVDIGVAFSSFVPWSPVISKGDKILHPSYGNLALKEIIEMPDLGGAVMGYRVRAE